jgi:translation initiation factor 2A
VKSGIQQYFDVSLISTEKNYLIAAVFLDAKVNKGNLLLFNHEKDEPIYEKSISKAEEIKIKFSPTSNKFLIELQTYYDPTGKSYYGEYGLYLYSDTSNKIAKIKTASGPVHDFEWDRKGEHYLVISGFMPAEPVLFSKNNEVVFEFGKQHKN